MSISGFTASVDMYVRGKTWYWYVPLWLFGLYVFYELFQFNMVKEEMPLVLLIPYSFDFVLHEFGHIFTALLPAVLTASAGSGSELLLGTTLVVMAFWQRSYFASLFSMLWFALTCQSAGQYMADAIPQQLSLVSLGGALSGQEPIHDWHFVFGQLGLLPESTLIGNAIRTFGMSVALCGLIFTAWLIYKMAAQPTTEPASPSALPTSLASTQLVHNIRSVDHGFTSIPIDTNRPNNAETSDHRASPDTPA